VWSLKRRDYRQYPRRLTFRPEDAGKTRYLTGILELNAKSEFAAGEEGYIKQAGFNAMMIEPRPHLLHDDAQIGAMAPDLNNVHSDPSRRAG
jgi:hypothetical protein